VGVGVGDVGLGAGVEVDDGDDRVFERVAHVEHVDGVGTRAPRVESRPRRRGRREVRQ
jgi:hypothetical protein